MASGKLWIYVIQYFASFNISYDDEYNLDSLHLCIHIMPFLNIHSRITCTSRVKWHYEDHYFMQLSQELKSVTIMSMLVNINAFSFMNLFTQCPDYIHSYWLSSLSRTHLVSSKLIVHFCIRCGTSRLPSTRPRISRRGLFLSRKRHSIYSISG